MRTFIKLSSLATVAGLLVAVGCGGDDSGSGTTTTTSTTGSGGSGGTSPSTGGSGGTSPSTGGSGGTSPSTGGSGGSSNTGGTGTGGTAGGGGMPPVDEAPYTNADCTKAGGPNSKVTGSKTGAFVEEDDWYKGWTNFKTDESGTDACDGDLTDLPIEDDGAFSDDDTTLTAEDGPYLLDQKVYVEDGQTLTIEPGAVFCGGPDGSLIVSRGGMIDAEGEPDNPILFTSLSAEGEKDRGDWGGVILLGDGKSFKGEDVLMEGLNGDPRDFYGGNNNSDNSGTIAYVRIEFGGTEIAEGIEINGLTFGAVGSGTTIHHVEVNTTLDDCYEWFGGAVKVDHMVCHNTGDDMFDGDEGWKGTIDTALGIGVEPVSEDPNGFEMDSDKGGATPVSFITAKNVTLCGSGNEENGVGYGMVLRENLTGAFSNIVISGFDAGVDTRDDFGSQSDPNVTIEDSMMFDMNVHTIAYDEKASETDESSPEFDDDNGFDERKWFEDGDGDMAYE